MEAKKKNMEPIIITPKSEQEYSFLMEMLKKMRVKVSSPAERKLRRMTMEEFNEEVDRSLEDARMGRTISHEELGKKIAEWR